MSAGRYAIGVAALAVVCGGIALAAVALRRRWLPGWTGAAARLAELGLGFALLTGVLELLGVVGLFRLWAIVVTCAVIGAVALLRGARHQPRVSGLAASAPGAAALVAASVVFAEWAAPALSAYAHGIRTFDSLWYHLPWAASYAQTGQIAGLRFTDVEYLTAFYPATAELYHGLGIALFGGGDLLSPGLNLGFLAGILLAAWVAGESVGRGWLAVLGAAVALSTPMLLLSQAGSAANDVVGVFFLLAAIALLLHHRVVDCVHPSGTIDHALVVAAVAAGLAVSVKLSLLAPVAALTVGVLLWRRRPRAAALWLGPLVAAGGFWYLRNLISVGNPLPWMNLPGLAVPAPPLQAHTAFSVAHYLGAAGGLWGHYFEPGLSAGLGRAWPAVLVAVALGALLPLSARRAPALRLAGFTAAISIVAYLLTPESAAGPAGQPSGFAFNLRYSAPALTLGLTLLPLSPWFSGQRARLALGAALSTLLILTLSRARLWPEAQLPGQLITGVAVLAIALAARRRLRLPAATALALAAAVLGYFGQRDYFRHRYAYQPGISHLAPVWAYFRHVAHARVGLAGTYGGFFAYPLYGRLDSNRMSYIGARGPHGSFTPITSCRAWRAAVNARHLQLLVTTPARDPWHPRRLTPSPERGWTVSDPAARIVFQADTGSQPATVFALSGPLRPTGCD